MPFPDSPSSLPLTLTISLATIVATVYFHKKFSNKLFNDLGLYVLTNHRSLIVVIFGLPLSFLWDTLLKIRSIYIHTFKSAPHLHDQRVHAVVAQVKARPDTNAPICTARPGWQSVSLSYRNYKKKWNAIQMPLYDILELDKSSMIVRVEPFVSIGQLTHALNPQGLTLPVVPEMDDLTVGGLINGTGIESSSHKYGLFHEIVTELELLLGDGTVVVATPDNEYSDLFHAIPWSYGTIALLLSAKLKLIPCKEFVKLTYMPFYRKEEYIESLRTLSGEDETDIHSKKIPMFLEGLAYSRNDAVVMKGEFVSKDEVDYSKTNRLALWYKPWFYKHVQSKLKSNEHTVEYIPLRDYYHRHTQSLFWEMELMIPIGNHILFRYLLGWLMPPKVSFLKVSQTEMTRQLVEKTHVAQDFLVPTRKMSEFIDSCHENFDQLYPLWLCLHDHSPMKGSILKDPLCPNEKKNGHEMYIDIGVYGLPKCVHEKREDEFDMKKSMKTVTAELRTMNGFQMLYADVFDEKKEFEEMFDHSQYREIRKKYKADTGIFKEVYDKMSVIL
mmetsp:Transcript_10172/g.11270  ORF Transcript_10172/g.11270 Transcript_10172/m.11270 type:complete len:556 (-) Transcript_10172:1666-3333(-)